MKKILVTGANGFLGLNCLNILQNCDFDIYAVARNLPENRNQNINWIAADLFDESQVNNIFKQVQPEYLLHLAWGKVQGMKLNSNIFYPWIEKSMDLIRKFAAYGGKRVIASGSCAEYKWGDYIYDEETTPLQPQSDHGICKNELHKQVSFFCNENDLTYAWGRIFFLYGPYENPKRLVPYVINSILNNEKVNTSDGHQIFDYSYVEDVARALVSLVDNKFNGPVNICSGQPVKVKDLIISIAKLLDAEYLLNIGAIETSKDAPNFVVGKNNRLKEIINWNNLTDLESGIKKTIGFIEKKENTIWEKL